MVLECTRQARSPLGEIHGPCHVRLPLRPPVDQGSLVANETRWQPVGQGSKRCGVDPRWRETMRHNVSLAVPTYVGSAQRR